MTVAQAERAGAAVTPAQAERADTADPRLDTILDDRFHLVACLGTGGMGVVYRATQLSVGRDVALKVLGRRPSDLANERFLREARLASQLSHPSIVTTYDCGRTASGDLWIAMEYLHGRSLREVLEQDGALALPRALAIAEQVAAALASAHAAGIVHRDVKPSNVMVTGDGRAKLLDFGLARADRSDDTLSLTHSGVVCGTPAYLAPEVALGAAADPRADLYGLGLVLHEMLAGGHAFAAATPEAQVSRRLNEAPPRLAGVPDAVAEVAQRLLARAPADRCPSASIACAWLAALREGQAPALPRPPRRRWRRPWLAVVPVAGFAAAFGLTHRPAPRVHTFHGLYTGAGNERCSHGRAWLAVDGDRVVGAAVSDLGQLFEIVGTRKPSGAIFGAFTLHEHTIGAFEGQLRDRHARGTTNDYAFDCTGSFDLTRDP